METRNLILTIIRIRKRLIQLRKCNRNIAQCNSMIKELQLQIDSYGKKWDDDGWKKFAIRNIDKLFFLLPENRSTQKIKEHLYELREHTVSWN